MSNTLKRTLVVLAAAAFALPAGAGIAAADNHNNDRGYHYYCDRDSRGYDWDYCWSHYKDEWKRDHNGGNGYGGGNGNGGGNGY
ncbi:hypothetical protein [Nocardia crassostreae]|uniref:hypothetical protein n=1 Tax=Nocardia crassostreae TaxID=53428 RepID=UPI00082A34B8|nr:hypothetical protein [Nocardia crassostreae]